MCICSRCFENRKCFTIHQATPQCEWNVVSGWLVCCLSGQPASSSTCTNTYVGIPLRRKSTSLSAEWQQLSELDSTPHQSTIKTLYSLNVTENLIRFDPWPPNQCIELCSLYRGVGKGTIFRGVFPHHLKKNATSTFPCIHFHLHEITMYNFLRCNRGVCIQTDFITTRIYSPLVEELYKV